MSAALLDLLDYLEVRSDALSLGWDGVIIEPVALSGRGPVLAFCEWDGERGERAVGDSAARVVLVRHSMLGRLAPAAGRTFIGCESPRLAFVRAVDWFWPEDADAIAGPSTIHSSAQIDDSACISSGVAVGTGCEIGAGSVVLSGVRLYRGTRLGKRVRVDANAVLGGPGFGFEREHNGRWRRFPQRGALIVEDDVEVGPGATIDRGALGNTIIGAGTKIDNLAYIGHNVVIGRDCLVMAGSVICGSCRLENGAVLSPGARVREGCTVGEDAHVGLGAVVVSDVAPRTVVLGVPARFVRIGSYRE